MVSAETQTTNPLCQNVRCSHSTIAIGTFCLCFGAALLAYTANSRSKRHNAVHTGIAAFIFPQIYLMQAGVRALWGDWILLPPPHQS